MFETTTVQLVMQPFGNREGQQTVMVELPAIPLIGDNLILGDGIDGKVTDVAYNILERLPVALVYARVEATELEAVCDKIEAAEKERKAKIASGYQLSTRLTEKDFRR